MANTDNPMGFRPYDADARMFPYEISATNSEILRGDVMEMPAAGYVSGQAAASSAPIIGIAAEYKAASSGGKILVYDDPNSRFICQLDGVGTALTVADLGRVFQMADDETSNNGIDSAQELDQSSSATTATHQFKLVGLVPVADLEAGTANAWGNHAKVIVQPNFHRLRSTTGI